MSESGAPDANIAMPSEIATFHEPVMKDRVVALLAPALQCGGAVYVDATLGAGGHASAILAACPLARLVGIDRDGMALSLAEKRLAAFSGRCTFIKARFDEVGQVLDDLGSSSVQAIFADFGLSSMQIDQVDRGFAYRLKSPLDMRMDTQQGFTAADIVNGWEPRELHRILRDYGDEPHASRIVSAIVEQRKLSPIQDSERLVEIITNALPAAVRHSGRGHPAKRTFQALRIAVNDELESIKVFLTEAMSRLDVGGRMAVLSYHSGEDRLVKQAFSAAVKDMVPPGLPFVPEERKAQMIHLVRTAQRPDEDEVVRNSRASAARLRAIERIRAEVKP